MKLAEGVQKENELREAGFAEPEIAEWRAQTTAELQQAGFAGPEVAEYFGAKNPDMAPTAEMLKANLAAWHPPMAASPEGGGPPVPAPKDADSFLEALEAGWQMSVEGLISRKNLPDTVLPEHAPMAYRIATMSAQLAGDVPAMIAGGLGGGAIGSALPGPGTAAGAAFGAWALPAGMRTRLMEHYEKGDVKDFGDFWERSSAVLWDSLKAGTIGVATAGAGGVAAKLAAKAAAPALIQTGTKYAAELATMASVGAAIEGHAPKASDFVDAAVLLVGMNGSMKAASKIRTIYAKTGIRPEQLAEIAQTDPTVVQDLAASNVEIPRAIEGMVEPTQKVAQIEPAKAAEPTPEPTSRPNTEAAAKILAQVGERKTPEGKSYSTQEFYKDFVDKLDPIDRGVKILSKNPETLAADEHPYQLARMANDYKAKVKHFVEKGVLDFNTLEKTGKSFKEIIEPHKKDLDGFSAYLISKRAIEVEGRGITSGFDVEAAKSVVKEGASKYDAAAKELVDYQNGVLKYAMDSGVISKESFKSMQEAGRAYLPLSRVMEEGAAGGKKGKASSLKKLKGSESKIQNPFLSILENSEALLRMSEKNRAIESFVSLAEKTDGQKIIEKVPNSMRPIEVKSEEIARALEEQGIEADPEAFTIFRAQSKKLAPNEFEVIREGKREVWAVKEDAPIGLAEAFKALDGDATAMNVLVRIARGFTTVKKLGISMTPDFVARNLFRDQMTAGVFTKGGNIPFRDMVVAMGDLVKKNDHYYNWLKSGGANGNFMELGKNYLDNNIFELNKETGFLDSTWNVVKKPVDYMRVAGELTEQATRLAEFKRVSKGESSGAKVFEGGFSSREVTVDFQRIGAKISALNSITAFMNVSVQGLDRTIRAVKENPVGVTTKAAAYITAPSILLWWANKDDPRWQEIPRWQKDMFWIVMTKDHVYRIPKPQELGIVFGSLPERVLEQYFTDNPNAMKDFEDTMQNIIAPSFVPDAISPVIEQYFNKSMFTGAPIVPRKLEGIMPEYQYTPYTSDTAKALGKMVATVPGFKNSSASSPAVIENYVQAWSGTLGKYALQVADEALYKTGVVAEPVKPASTLADIPFIKAFAVRFPSATAQSIQDFHESYYESVKVLNTIQHLTKTGDITNAQKELSDPDNQALMFKLAGVQEALATQNKAVQLIYANPSISRDEKRQLIDGIYNLMIQEAKLGNKALRDLKKKVKDL